MWETQSHVSVFTLNIHICFAQCKHFVGTVQPTQHQTSGVKVFREEFCIEALWGTNTSLARAYNRSYIDIRITFVFIYFCMQSIHAEISSHEYFNHYVPMHYHLVTVQYLSNDASLCCVSVFVSLRCWIRLTATQWISDIIMLCQFLSWAAW